MGDGQRIDEQYPEAFESVYTILHQAFVKAASIMANIGIEDKKYWYMQRAAEALLKASRHLIDASYEWHQFSGTSDKFWKDELPEQENEQLA